MFSPEEREITINQFMTEIKSAQAQLIEVLKKVIANQKISEQEIFDSVSKINFFQLLQAKTDINQAITKFLSKYDEAVQKIDQYIKSFKIAPISGVSLDQLMSVKVMDSQMILRRAEMFGSELKSEVAKVILTGVSRKTIIDRLLPQINQTVTFHAHWFRVALNQSFTHFQNIALQKGFEDTPGQRFILEHPKDERNREECVIAMRLMEKYPQGLTIQQINGGSLGSNYTFIDLGGFNCRGFFRVVNEK